MGYIDDDLVAGAISHNKTSKKNIWRKWGALAACLCLVIVGALLAPGLTDSAHDYAETVIYNGAEYYVCGPGEAGILASCGLPSEITKDLAGAQLGCLTQTEKNTYHISEDATDADAELFEYAPQPNGNVYIIRIDGEYYAAIRKDGDGYHGLADPAPAE